MKSRKTAVAHLVVWLHWLCRLLLRAKIVAMTAQAEGDVAKVMLTRLVKHFCHQKILHPILLKLTFIE